MSSSVAASAKSSNALSSSRLKVPCSPAVSYTHLPVVLTAINVNEFQVSANTKTSHCNNRLKSFVEYDGVICQIDKVTQEPKDEILNCVLSFTEEREVYDLDRCQSFYVIHVKTSISEADVIIPKEQLDTLYSVLKKRFPEISFNAEMCIRDSAILALCIRTALYYAGVYYIRASAGIVADSIPENEWNETLNKLAATYSTITGKSIFEVMEEEQ